MNEKTHGKLYVQCRFKVETNIPTRTMYTFSKWPELQCLIYNKKYILPVFMTNVSFDWVGLQVYKTTGIYTQYTTCTIKP